MPKMVRIPKNGLLTQSEADQLGEDLVFDIIAQRHAEIAQKIEHETGEEPETTDERLGIYFGEMQLMGEPFMPPVRLQYLLDRLIANNSIRRLASRKYGLY